MQSPQAIHWYTLDIGYETWFFLTYRQYVSSILSKSSSFLLFTSRLIYSTSDRELNTHVRIIHEVRTKYHTLLTVDFVSN